MSELIRTRGWGRFCTLLKIKNKEKKPEVGVHREKVEWHPRMERFQFWENVVFRRGISAFRRIKTQARENDPIQKRKKTARKVS